MKKYSDIAKKTNRKQKIVTIRVTDEKLHGFLEQLQSRGVNLSHFTRLIWKDTLDYAEYLTGLNNTERNLDNTIQELNHIKKEK